ncbi:NIF-domain-containing protein [Glonium stellatum]|uniref:Mitochondrial import inner membrane translocase subunit TIM50 n=1 Tax=Glonium stellatum TaxID=574774 RepID=A0A8E2JS03_9PEZI|nr:NIF-domain-containing protein [Glonium stellatum]
MLSRAATRAFKPRPTLSPFPAASTSQWIRQYANRPPKKPSSFESERNKTPNRDRTWKPSQPLNLNLGKTAYSGWKEESKGKKTDYSKEQAEVDAGASPERNTGAQYGGAGSGVTERVTAESGPQETYSKSQEEFDSPQTPQSNATTAGHGSSQPLPDLRQGIPSTFDAEFGAAAAETKPAPRSVNVSEDAEREPSPAAGGVGGGREGSELPKSAYETSVDRRRNRVANYSYLMGAILGVVGAVYLGRDWENEEEERAHPEAPSGWGLMLMYDRARARLASQMGYYTEPTFPKLLPDMDPAPPYTLVLSLEDLLVHSEWTREHGWRTAKRPGVDYFLRYLSQYYELVIFTSLPSTSADPVIRKLDPFRVVMWPLFREATRYEKGEYIKDLSYLNRDLSKTILIDTKAAHAKLQPENAIILPPWTGQPNDRNLVSLIPFLEYIATMGITDVRKALASFEGTDIATEFARREAKAREAFNAQLAAERAKRPKHSASSWLMGALGLKGSGAGGGAGGLVVGEQSAAEGFEQGKMLSDQIRERGMKQYEAMEKEIRENGEKWLREMAEEEKKLQEEQMKSMKSGMVGWFGGKKE